MIDPTLAATPQWVAANKERLRAYDASPERRAKSRERARLRRQQDPDGVRAADRASCARRRPHRIALKAAWREANPGASTHEARWSYFKKRGLVPAWANRKAVEYVYRTAAVLRQATGVEFQVDHVVPIRGKTVCGLHCEANLQIVRANRPDTAAQE